MLIGNSLLILKRAELCASRYNHSYIAIVEIYFNRYTVLKGKNSNYVSLIGKIWEDGLIHKILGISTFHWTSNK